MQKFSGLITQLSEDRHACSGGAFIYVKNYVVCAELGVYEDSEIVAVEVKGRNPKCT
jgi:hypothetical protein